MIFIIFLLLQAKQPLRLLTAQGQGLFYYSRQAANPALGSRLNTDLRLVSATHKTTTTIMFFFQNIKYLVPQNQGPATSPTAALVGWREGSTPPATLRTIQTT